MRTRVRAGPLLALGVLVLGGACRQEPAGGTDDTDELYDLALGDRGRFAKRVTAGARTDFERAHAVVTWFAEHFDWTATDYQVRTVDEILGRRGGNCNELAQVAQAMMEEIGLPMRRVREINLHVESEARQQTAEQKVAEMGARMSVFGRRHNDHVWIEVQDRETGEWFPADPSLGVVGGEEWLAARLGFGERFTLDPTSADMVAPFALFAEDGDGRLAENRTAHYVIDGFDALYSGRLRRLPAWPDWVRLVDRLDDEALGAFRGEVNCMNTRRRSTRWPRSTRPCERSTRTCPSRPSARSHSGRPIDRRSESATSRASGTSSRATPRSATR